MSDYTGLGELVEQMRETSRSIELSDSKMANRVDAIEASVDELYRKTQHPGGFGGDPGETDERKTCPRSRPANMSRPPPMSMKPSPQSENKLLTMPDSIGRQLLQELPQEQPAFMLCGSPIMIASQMPDCAPGSTPIAFGN